MRFNEVFNLHVFAITSTWIITNESRVPGLAALARAQGKFCLIRPADPDHQARIPAKKAVAAPKALGQHCTLLCNCRGKVPNFARELAGEANAEAGDWWKRAQEGEHRTRRAATPARPAVVLSVHLPSLGLVIGRDLRSASVGRAAAGDGSSYCTQPLSHRRFA